MYVDASFIGTGFNFALGGVVKMQGNNKGSFTSYSDLVDGISF
ncbi:hypothetical protein HNR74_004996 [Flammeovirga kamogawensis]|nr:hypothetical protein [Flammeovirga kamogawensis]